MLLTPPLAPQVLRPRLRRNIAVAALAGTALALAVVAAAFSSWFVPKTARDPQDRGCPTGSYPYWVSNGDECVFAGFQDPLRLHGSLTNYGVWASSPDVSSTVCATEASDPGKIMCRSPNDTLVCDASQEPVFDRMLGRYACKDRPTEATGVFASASGGKVNHAAVFDQGSVEVHEDLHVGGKLYVGDRLAIDEHGVCLICGSHP